MARTPVDITEAELAVLQVLWDHGPSTIRKLTDALYPEGRASQYATVQKLLERLESKGFVRRDRSQAVHRFGAALEREELLGRRLRSIADTLCGGSWTPVLSHLIQNENLSADEVASLRDFIDRLVAKPKKGGKS